jgi:hypothetical protein
VLFFVKQVGGFSAFVGLVCFESAVSIIINDHVAGLRDLLTLDTDVWTLVLPPLVMSMPCNCALTIDISIDTIMDDYGDG